MRLTKDRRKTFRDGLKDRGDDATVFVWAGEVRSLLDDADALDEAQKAIGELCGLLEDAKPIILDDTTHPDYADGRYILSMKITKALAKYEAMAKGGAG